MTSSSTLSAMSVPIGLLDFDASLEIDDADITGILTAPETRISGDVFWYSAPLMLAMVTACAGISCYVTAAASQTGLWRGGAYNVGVAYWGEAYIGGGLYWEGACIVRRAYIREGLNLEGAYIGGT